MTDAANDPRRQAWSSYWAQGALHSCTGSFDARYSGAIGAFWDAVVAEIPPGSRVLDLATGNGALPLRLWETLGATSGIRIDAVDLATLAPPWHDPGKHQAITFHSGVAMERLPFADASFDLVASQFGLEYARWPEALLECIRVARGGARLAFVMHHAGSVLVSVGREELANQEFLLATGGLLDAARGVLPWLARARAGGAGIPQDSRATEARDAYNMAVGGVGQAIAASAVPDALVEARDWVHRLVGSVTPDDLPARTDALAAYREAMASAALRTREMLVHALHEGRVGQAAAALEAACPGCQVRYEPLSQREGILAWGVVASIPRTSNKGPSDPA